MRKGFSIGEVLVAMFILLIGIVDVIYLTGRGVTETRSASNAVIATMLAQEGTEFVRNVRDNNVTRMDCGSSENERCTAFGQFFPNVGNFMGAGMFCTIDVNGSKPMTCSGASGDGDDTLFVNTDTGLYSHKQEGDKSAATPFRRRIYVQYSMTNNDPLDDQSSNHLVADVTSVVLFGKKDFSDLVTNVSAVAEWCKIGVDCAFAQTRLTSWNNYDN